jgi:uncharacterized membrane protein YozB (DUF420 family)
MRKHSFPITATLTAGLLLIWAGERVAEAGKTRLVLTSAGAAIGLAAAAWRFWRRGQVKSDAKVIEVAFSRLTMLVVVSVGLYFLLADPGAKALGHPLETDWPKLATVLAVLWPVLLACAFLPLVMMELSYASMVRAPHIEAGRVRAAMWSGLGLAFTLTFAFALQYVVSERDVKFDLAYFRTTKPGEATRKLAASLTEPIKATLFFAPVNDVGAQVEEYFNDLIRNAPMLQVERLDHALEPKRARELGVSGNGIVVVSRGERKESLIVGDQLESARTQLKSLDQDVNKRLLAIAKSKRTIYLTEGHGERAEETMASDAKRPAISAIRNELKAQNYELRKLGLADGLANEVPKDAAAVMVMGPKEDFSELEAKSLAEYQKSGGKMFIALDPEAGSEFKALLTPLGLGFRPVLLADDVVHAKVSNTLADRAYIATRGFSSHPSVTTNGRGGFPMFTMGAGAIDELSPHPAELVVDFPVRTEATTWNDVNGNFNYDKDGGEARKAYGLAAAVTRRPSGSTKVEDEMRVLVLGDSDAVADIVLPQAKGNAVFVIDGLKWLLGDEQLAGTTNSEVDVTVMRNREQDKLWFYGSIFLAPALVMVVGVLARRRARRLPRPAPAAPPAPTEAT